MTEFPAGTRVKMTHPESGDLFGVVTRSQQMGESLLVEVELEAGGKLDGDTVVVDSKFLEKVN